MPITYATRESVRDSLEVNATAYANTKIDQKLAAAMPSIENRTHRRFYPEIRTIRMDWPNYQYSNSWQLYLGSNELISVDTLSSGGTTLTQGTDFFLRRSDDKAEPPYDLIEIDLSSSAAFSSGTTFQRSIVITGVFGYDNNTEVAATLASAINTSVTTIDVLPVNSQLKIGVGSLLTIGTEKLLTISRLMIDSTQNTQSSLSSSQAGVSLLVSDGSAFAIDEILLVDAERMKILDIAGNVLIVRRAYDGTPLAAHNSGVDIYALRRFGVVRAQLGTTAASHSQSDVINSQVFAPLISELNRAEAIVLLEQQSSAYARTIGSGERQQEAVGMGLEDLRLQVRNTYARKSRIEAI